MLVKRGKCVGFCVYRRSYLLCMVPRNIMLEECGNDESDRSTVANSKQWSAAGFLDLHQVLLRLYARRLQSNQHYTRGRTIIRIEYIYFIWVMTIKENNINRVYTD